ncbi:Ankyrin repeat [Colwellia chukchiensis]|uniref:Ankyrin repeat n=1 Tax=Colwellia chukchiensis TaxID=641665 RepID=A0A1H7SWU8_9GAMM|nr:ankyrin repeat domain-containing protein [Colwellia chukchiensis]SEL76918.1 Ankyrin repeat [Colwellia chukchiensis]
MALPNKQNNEQAQHCERVLQAINNNDDNELKELLATGAIGECIDREGNTPVMLAARNNNQQTLAILLSQDVNLDRLSYDDYSALIYATMYHHYAICKQLIDAGANVNLQNSAGKTALMYAVKVNNVEIVQLLIAHGADAKIVDNNLQFPSDYLYSDYTTPRSRKCKKLIKKAEGNSKYFTTKINKFKRYMAGTHNSFVESKDLSASLKFSVYDAFDKVPHLFSLLAYVGYIFIPLWYIANSLLMMFTTKKLQLYEINDISFKDADIAFVKSILKVSNVLPTLKPTNANDAISRKASIFTQWLFTIVITIALMLGWQARINAPDVELSYLVSIISLLVIVAIDIARRYVLLQLVTKRLYLEQQSRDKKAHDIVESISAGDTADPVDFAVYLRPFKSTGKLHNKQTGIEIETALALVFPDELPIISLGEPGEHIGTCRVKTDEEKWQAIVATMLLKAKLIILLPSMNEGTLWEINHIIERGYLDKTIFLMLPKRDENDEKSAARWHKLMTHLMSLGLQLPSQQSYGLIFTLNTNGQLKSHMPFNPPPQYQDQAVHQEYIDTAMRSIDMN